jgi:peroxiredoxin
VKRRDLALLVIVGLLATVTGAWLGSHWRERPAQQASIVAGALLEGERRPGFDHGAADGRRIAAGDFDGQVLLVNFWATWCEPCREEMPMLDTLQNELGGRGLAVVGIALDDVQRSRDFIARLGIGYTVLVGAGDVLATSRAWGNEAGLLPYSVLVDRDGIVRWVRYGELEREELQARIEALL